MKETETGRWGATERVNGRVWGGCGKAYNIKDRCEDHRERQRTQRDRDRCRQEDGRERQAETWKGMQTCPLRIAEG